ncbi:VWA domain-containing protein [Fulvimarina sp. MAC3]|uniref:vWA domain-containing protein n=1 Tax=Fulvimarina sp. MAC3 TaxID=3148887 RepID=UPI0031FD7C1C
MTVSKSILRLSLVAFCLLAAPISATAEDADLDDATRLVRVFFADHTDRFQSGAEPLLNDAEAASPYLVDSLAIDGLQGRLQFDPVYGGQDADIANLQIMPDPELPMLRGAAQIRVSFTNFGALRTFIYTLVKVPGGDWQISDIYSEEEGWSLDGLMREAGVNYAQVSGKEITLQDGAMDTVEAIDNPPDDVGMNPADLQGNMAENPKAGEDAPEDVDSPSTEDVAPADETAAPARSSAAEAGGSDLLFVLDGSGSMWGQIDGVAKVTTAKQALKGLIGDLDRSTNVGLIAYGHNREGDCGDIDVVLPIAPGGEADVGPAIDAITPRGKTPIAGALEAATGAFSGGDRAANVLLISDGLETCGGDPCAAAAALAGQGISTRVHVVGFDLTDEEAKALQCIAERGNGNYYAANDADEFADAINQAVEIAKAEPAPAPAPEPGPMPVPEPVSTSVFEETFDGPEIDPAWSIVNENEELKALDGEGALFIAAVGTKSIYDREEAVNRLVLEEPLPDGDFDLLTEARFVLQTSREHISVSVFEDTNNQIGAVLWTEGTGCGTRLIFSIVNISGEPGAKPEKSAFEQNLFDGPIIASMCNAEQRAYADTVLASLAEKPAIIRLERRGRQLTASVELELPASAEEPARPFRFEIDPLTVLRLSGKPSLFAGQWSKGAPGESHFFIDRFAIEKNGS